MDDQQHLQQHGQSESFLLLVDSSNRDQSLFPEPNAYQVQLERPFYAVTSIQVLSAQFPRASMHVDQGSNDVLVVNGKEFKLPHGDYKMTSVCTELTTLLASEGITVQPLSSPPEKTNRVVFSSQNQFTLNFADPRSLSSRTHELLGFGGSIKNTTAAVDSTVSTGTSVKQAYLGPLSAMSSRFETISATRSVRQRFNAKYAGKITGVSFVLQTSGAINFRIVDAHNAEFAKGTFPSSTTPQQLAAQLSGTVSQSLAADALYYVEFSASGLANGKVYRNVSNVASPEVSSVGDIFVSASGGAYAAISDETHDCCGKVDVETGGGGGGYVMVSPGPMVLTGERYVRIRSDLENLVYRDRAFENTHTAGLGWIRLGSYGFVDQNTQEFVSYPPRVIDPPIAKLSQFTLRFETRSGALYNTHGVDHTLLILVRYLSMKPQLQAPTQINSNYMQDRYIRDVSR